MFADTSSRPRGGSSGGGRCNNRLCPGPVPAVQVDHPRSEPYPCSSTLNIPAIGEKAATTMDGFPAPAPHTSYAIGHPSHLQPVGPDDAGRAHTITSGGTSSEISRNTLPRSVAAMLRAASPANFSSSSAPTKNRFNSLAATAVVPEPEKGSKTRPPSRVQASRARRMSLRGF